MKNKIIKILMVLACCVIIVSCDSSQKDEANDYFYNIDKEVVKIGNQPEKIKALQAREQKKYKSTGDRKYLISSNYIDLFNNYSHSKQIPIVYNLLMLNNNEHDYIAIACNFNLAFQFEHQSPKLAMQFLNDAIKIDEKSGEKYYLPHLYHLKGRFFFNNGNYSQAMIYFNKSLQSLDKTRYNLVFIASMHNNFALTYEKMGNIDLAIKETKEALRILESEKNLKADETSFLVSVKGNMGFIITRKRTIPKQKNFFFRNLSFKGKIKKMTMMQ